MNSEDIIKNYKKAISDNNLVKALALLQYALEMQIDHVILCQYTCLLHRLRYMAQAKFCASWLCELDSDNYYYHYVYASIYWDCGDNTNSEKHINICLELKHDYDPAKKLLENISSSKEYMNDLEKLKNNFQA
jgi:hypothetical protein